MFWGMVETDSGEILNIMHAQGTIGGNPILIFWTALSNYCSDKSGEDLTWFKSAEILLGEDLCSFCQPFLQSLCDGEWNYHEEDYDLYLMRAGDSKMPLEEFLKRVSDVEKSWVDIQPLINCIMGIVNLLRSDSDNEPYENAQKR